MGSTGIKQSFSSDGSPAPAPSVPGGSFAGIDSSRDSSSHEQTDIVGIVSFYIILLGFFYSMFCLGSFLKNCATHVPSASRRRHGGTRTWPVSAVPAQLQVRPVSAVPVQVGPVNVLPAQVGPVSALTAQARMIRHLDDYMRAGLPDSVKASLPTFLLDSDKAGMECVVCFEVLKKGEKILSLPKCKHSFHIDCISMWFQSHSTCPTCRCTVAPGAQPSYRPNVLVEPIPLPREGLHSPELHINISTP